MASATKGALAIVAHRLAERGELDLDAPVARYWPKCAAAAKERLPVRWLLCQQAGLPAIRRELSTAEIAGWTVPVAALAAVAPEWEPGSEHGYHAIIYEWLGEVVSRVTGTTCGQVFAEEVARPLRLLDPGSLAHWAFLLPSGLTAVMNDPVIWAAELPAANGIGTAQALARLYAAVIGSVDGVRLLAPDTVARATEEHCRGIDRVIGPPRRRRRLLLRSLGRREHGAQTARSDFELQRAIRRAIYSVVAGGFSVSAWGRADLGPRHMCATGLREGLASPSQGGDTGSNPVGGAQRLSPSSEPLRPS